MERKKNIKLPPRSFQKIIRLIQRYKLLKQEKLRIKRSLDRKLGAAKTGSNKARKS